MRFETVRISSGYGPIEVREFVSRLASRIERICGDCGLHVCELTCEGPENAPLSVELPVSGGASVALVGERGTHELVARSPLRGRASRKRWFAAVSIPEHFDAPDDIQPLAIKESELIVTATKAGGKGGQHVNKVSTAVRVQHPASGVSVRVASIRLSNPDSETPMWRSVQRSCVVDAELCCGSTVRSC